jgi:hypothetical protein
MGTFKIMGGLYQQPPEELGVDTLSPYLFNAYEDGQGNTVKRPGFALWKDMGVAAVAIQGMFFWETAGFMIVVVNGNAYKVEYDKTVTNQTSVALTNTTNPATFACDGTSLWIASGGKCSYIASSIADMIAVADGDCPSSSTFVRYMNGYIIVNNVGTSQVNFSSPLTRTNWDPNDFFAVDGIPDTCVALDVFGNELYAFGSKHFEIWYNDGVSPFARVPGAVYSVGACAPYTVGQVGGGLYWLDDQRRLMRMEGRTARPLSMDIQKTFDSLTYVTDAIICDASVLGNSWLLITFPQGSNDSDVSFCYDILSNKWYQWGPYISAPMNYGRILVSTSCYVGSSTSQAVVSTDAKQPTVASSETATGRTLTWQNPNGVVDGNSTSAYLRFSATTSTLDHTSASQESQFIYSESREVTWADLTNVFSQDLQYTTATDSSNNVLFTKRIIVTGSGLSVQVGATNVIVNVTMILKGSTSYNCTGNDNVTVYVYYDGAVQGWSSYRIPITTTATSWSLPVNYYLTKDIIDKADFGVGVSAYLIESVTSPFTLYIDSIKVSAVYSIPYTSGAGSNRLVATGFDFSGIPDDAIITGIRAEVVCETADGSKKSDFEMYLTKNGTTVVGDNRSYGMSFESGETRMYGGYNDLWGTSLTVAEAKQSTFGVMFAGDSDNNIGSLTISEIKMYIYYLASYSTYYVASSRLFGSGSNDNIYELRSDQRTDDGTSIRIMRRSGNITYKTLEYKRPSALKIRVKRSIQTATIPSPTMQIRWNTDGEGWTPYIDIPLDKSIASGGIMNYTLHRLGIYRERQYEIVYDYDTEFIFIEMEEEVDILGHTNPSKR